MNRMDVSSYRPICYGRNLSQEVRSARVNHLQSQATLYNKELAQSTKALTAFLGKADLFQ